MDLQNLFVTNGQMKIKLNIIFFRTIVNMIHVWFFLYLPHHLILAIYFLSSITIYIMFDFIIYICVRVCLCLRPLTVKALSVWSSWNVREQINDVVL